MFLDGQSNLVFRAAKDGDTYFSGKLFGKYRGPIGTTWEARIKLNCLTPGCWPAWYLANNNPVQRRRSRPHGVVRQRPAGLAGTTVHAKLNGGEHVSHTDRGGQRLAHLARPVG